MIAATNIIKRFSLFSNVYIKKIKKLLNLTAIQKPQYSNVYHFIRLYGVRFVRLIHYPSLFLGRQKRQDSYIKYASFQASLYFQC